MARLPVVRFVALPAPCAGLVRGAKYEAPRGAPPFAGTSPAYHGRISFDRLIDGSTVNERRMRMDERREQQMAQAEEILADSLEKPSFVKGFSFGEFRADLLPPYPDFSRYEGLAARVDQLQSFARESIDAAQIDRDAEIPDSVVQGLGKLGVLGACLPQWAGGHGLSQVEYCRLLEVLGGHCASTALFVNAHHSIGPRAIVLFGTRKQQEQYLPKLASGEWISAFALTEPEAGSDAANVQTRAEPSPDGKYFTINGEKRWITNGSIAQVLTLMARTPLADQQGSAITAFIVSPDMPGFEVTEARMDKCGVRGTVTSRLAFHNMKVPAENVLGRMGKGLKVALTVLDFGRTTFGATCTGVAKECLRLATIHASQRVQFQQPIGQFELVKEKIAFMRAMSFAMEACTYQTAALIDAGTGDFMLETAMLKVFATEALWRIIYDTFQIYGGMAYFTDQPFERMMRDARINSIGEGANDVLRAFVALVGMRDVGMDLEATLHALFRPVTGIGVIGRFAARKISSLVLPPSIEYRSSALEKDAGELAALIGSFGSHVERLLRIYQTDIVDRQYQLGRIADAVIELYASTCVLRRLDHILADHHLDESAKQRQLKIGRYYLLTACRRIRQSLKQTRENDDEATTAIADLVLRGEG